MKATWRELIGQALEYYHESWESVVYNTLSGADMDKEFDDGYGSAQGLPFTVWTHKRVYFPAVYDGAEWVSSVSRNPDDHATGHIGGQ